MRIRLRHRWSFRQALSALAVAFACCVALLCGACSKNTTAPGGAYLRGSVAFVVRVTDADGNVVDSLTEATDSGVRVRVLTRAGLRDSAASVHGTFIVQAASDTTWLVIGPSVATSDTLGPWFVGSGGLGGVALQLHDKGSLVVFNTATPDAALQVMFGVGQVEHVIIRIRSLDGRVVRTLVDGMLAAGLHTAVWDTNNDGGAPVPAGSYWVTCELGVAISGAQHASPLAISPALPPDAAGSRVLVRLVRS